MRALTYLCTAALLLAGCASAPPKRAMQDDDYRSFGTTWVAYNKCGASGHMPATTAAEGLHLLGNSLRSHTYDASRLEAVVKATNYEPTQAQCNQLVVDTQRVKLQTQANSEAARANQAAIDTLAAQIANFGKSNQIYCNSIGTQTICNKY